MFVTWQGNTDGECLFELPKPRPKIGEWWLVGVSGYKVGDPRVKNEEYYALVEEELGSDIFGAQDLAEESRPEKDVALDRFVQKLDPKQIDDSELSGIFAASKAKSHMEVTPKGRDIQSEDHADAEAAKANNACCPSAGDVFASSPLATSPSASSPVASSPLATSSLA